MTAVLRQWRVLMKSGETWIVTAERLEPISYLGLSFIKDGVAVAGMAYATYTSWEEIDPETGETLHVRRIPAPAGAADNAKVSKAIKPHEKTQMIRSLKAGDDHYNDHGDATEIGKLLECMEMGKSEGETMKDVRAEFLVAVGGFPPKTRARFNKIVASAVEQKMIEVYDVET